MCLFLASMISRRNSSGSSFGSGAHTISHSQTTPAKLTRFPSQGKIQSILFEVCVSSFGVATSAWVEVTEM